jgi:tellurite resistance protein
MTVTDIRCSNDTRLSQRLLEHADVKRVRDMISRAEEKGPLGTRRRLLSTSVRLSPAMAPALHDMVGQCREKLGIDIPLEVYAFSSPQFNAACFKPEEGRLFVMFSSSLLEAFDEKELLFVMGHEFGHHVYQHHDIPVGYLLQGQQKPPADLVLGLFAWSRYAEISADRAGAWCAEDFEAVARALFKLASGISDGKVVRFSLDDFLAQLDEMQAVDAEPGQGAPMQDWFSTHPFSPLRVKALQLFHQSALMRAGGTDKAELELGVQGLMSLMEPDYIEGKTDAAKNMKLLFIAGAVAVADAHNGISKDEEAVLKKYLGPAFSLRSLNVEKLVATIPDRARATMGIASRPQRMQVLRDICNVARAEGECHQAELAVLGGLADRLEIPREFVFQCLQCSAELD